MSDVADTVVPELKLALAEVQRTFDLWRAAQSKVNRSRKPASLATARRQCDQAERAYRAASDQRDKLVELRNARLTQRGDDRGALWSRPDGVDAPVLCEHGTVGCVGRGEKHWCDHRTIKPKITRAGGYNPALGPEHPGNQDPTLEPSTWSTSQLVVYLAKSAARACEPANGIIDGALDLAVARELDRRVPR